MVEKKKIGLLVTRGGDELMIYGEEAGVENWCLPTPWRRLGFEMKYEQLIIIFKYEIWVVFFTKPVIKEWGR